ncbi:helix-turn-helix domain-containing protein [Aeromicrobium sp. Leaf291]|uniref:helix-turn-helix domain-containing protein n=1 Tax=Aeromicrobium sp. Leaf291 TaxID=1736325 RepID=UPI0006F62FC7|nr:helix-turn-helix domain-containing protein [Aeromicrobium sp. Leaf291]KQP81629.1 hypothetical protein ASF35_16490 [Aeromicrobium sp. Leaf291]
MNAHVARLPDPREDAAALVVAVHAGNVLTTQRVLRRLDGEELRTLVQYLAACIDPDRPLLPTTGDRRSDEDIVESAVLEAASMFCIASDYVRSTSRHKLPLRARMVAMNAAHRLGVSAASIGRCLDRDHTTVLNANRRVAADDLLDTLAARVAERVIERVVGNTTP